MFDPVNDTYFQDKISCRWAYLLAVWLLRRPIRMAKSRLEKTEEEFNARMAKISAEAKNPNNSQDKPIQSSKEVFGALFSPALKEE